MLSRLKFYFNRLKEQLWVRPLFFSIVSVVAVFVAKLADQTDLEEFVPKVESDSIELLLTTISASMLVISTFAVASMISAYAAASGSATPRSFSLVIADDVSQNALSAFIGAFIFSIVALVALKNSYYDKAGNFTLFVMLLLVFIAVILTFLRWVDRIARLGRLGNTISKVEEATLSALNKRRLWPAMGGVAVQHNLKDGIPIYAEEIGYVQQIDIESLQVYAEETDTRVIINALPGTFTAPGREIAHIVSGKSKLTTPDSSRISKAFTIGESRVFDDDPRFGLIVLSEIASRALSPAVNDPGTAISVIGTLVRLFSIWVKPIEKEEMQQVLYDRVEVPPLSIYDMFDDAFIGIARDGAGAVEVGIRLQKAFTSLAYLPNPDLKAACIKHAKLALARAEKTLDFEDDFEAIKNISPFYP